jgi:predicted alpha/beta superfamily hydrolase
MVMKGSLIKDTFEDREITIYIPPSCGAWNMTFPLLFVQDGEYLFETNAELLEHRFADGTLPEMILAGVKPHNRLDEYTPWHSRALVNIHPDFGGRGEDYIRFLTDRLKPYLQCNYYASGSRSETGIIGASLGGLISLYAASKRPDVFSKAGLISASLWYEGMLSFIRQEAASMAKGDGRYFFSVGTMEGVGKVTVQKDMVPLTRQAVHILTEGGIGPDRLKFVVTDGDIHEHSCFVRRFPEAVEWLFGQKENTNGILTA